MIFSRETLVRIYQNPKPNISLAVYVYESETVSGKNQQFNTTFSEIDS